MQPELGLDRGTESLVNGACPQPAVHELAHGQAQAKGHWRWLQGLPGAGLEAVQSL